jgi:hypothetical protein
MEINKIKSTDIFKLEPDFKVILEKMQTIPMMYFNNNNTTDINTKYVKVIIEKNRKDEYYMKLSNLEITTPEGDKKTFHTTDEYNNFFEANPSHPPNEYKYRYLIDESKYITGDIGKYNDKSIKIKESIELTTTSLSDIEKDLLEIYKTFYTIISSVAPLVVRPDPQIRITAINTLISAAPTTNINTYITSINDSTNYFDIIPNELIYYFFDKNCVKIQNIINKFIQLIQSIDIINIELITKYILIFNNIVDKVKTYLDNIVAKFKPSNNKDSEDYIIMIINGCYTFIKEQQECINYYTTKITNIKDEIDNVIAKTHLYNDSKQKRNIFISKSFITILSLYDLLFYILKISLTNTKILDDFNLLAGASAKLINPSAAPVLPSQSPPRGMVPGPPAVTNSMFKIKLLHNLINMKIVLKQQNKKYDELLYKYRDLKSSVKYNNLNTKSSIKKLFFNKYDKRKNLYNIFADICSEFSKILPLKKTDIKKYIIDYITDYYRTFNFLSELSKFGTLIVGKHKTTKTLPKIFQNFMYYFKMIPFMYIPMSIIYFMYDKILLEFIYKVSGFGTNVRHNKEAIKQIYKAVEVYIDAKDIYEKLINSEVKNKLKNLFDDIQNKINVIETHIDNVPKNNIAELKEARKKTTKILDFLNSKKGYLKLFIPITAYIPISSKYYYPEITLKTIQKYGRISNINNIIKNKSQNIVDTYYSIKSNLDKLNIIKNYIVSILSTSQTKLQNDKVPKSPYNLDDKNIIIDLKDDITSTFNNKFNKFKNDFINANFNLVSGNKDDYPYFYTIFQNIYNDKDKTFFINLFKEYNKIRMELINEIEDNYGLLAFYMVFDLSDIYNYSKRKNDEIKRLKKNNKNNNNKYVLYEPNALPPLSSAPSAPSKISYKNVTSKNLYTNVYDVTYYNTKNKKDIEIIYKDLVSYKKKVFNTSDMDLYNVLINYVNLDFCTINFLFNYVEPSLFNNFITNHIKIKKYIINSINIFDKYEDKYVYWFDKLKATGATAGPPPVSSSLDKIEDYEKFLDSELGKI